MDRRIELDGRLRNVCPHVYFQPPATVSLEYPCIIYSLQNIDSIYADNDPYGTDTSYSIMYITKNPDDPVRYELAKFRLCRFERHYTADNLNHYIYRLYY